MRWRQTILCHKISSNNMLSTKNNILDSVSSNKTLSNTSSQIWSNDRLPNMILSNAILSNMLLPNEICKQVCLSHAFLQNGFDNRLSNKPFFVTNTILSNITSWHTILSDEMMSNKILSKMLSNKILLNTSLPTLLSNRDLSDRE